MNMRGIDISKHNGAVNWVQVKADGVQFAILRAGYGKEAAQKDTQFEANYAGCKAQGIPCGAYWYSYATTPAEARQEAAVCLSFLQGKTFAFPIYFDIEEQKVLAQGKTACTAIAKAFLETVEKAGYFVGIYSSKSHLESCFTEELRTRYAVWVAHYGVEKTTYHGQYGIWQKSAREGLWHLRQCGRERMLCRLSGSYQEKGAERVQDCSDRSNSEAGTGEVLEERPGGAHRQQRAAVRK